MMAKKKKFLGGQQKRVADENYKNASRFSKVPLASSFLVAVFVPVILSMSVFQITSIYVALPGFAGSLILSLLICFQRHTFLRWRSNMTCKIIALLYGFVFISLLVAALVFVFSVYFLPMSGLEQVRLGAVTSDSIRVWARSPSSDHFKVKFRRLNMTLQYQWNISMASSLTLGNDFTGVLQINGLTPSSKFEYTVVFGNGHMHSGLFRTLPLEHSPSSFRFVFGSCTMKSLRAGYGLTGLEKVSQFAPLFWMHLGDYIYADVPLTFGLGSDVDAYRAHYRRTLSDPYLEALERTTPGFFMYDDHEIVNDITEEISSVNAAGPSPHSDTFIAAVSAWKEYVGALNPQGSPFSNSTSDYFTYVSGEACFFVFDTRGLRSTDYILGTSQLAAAKAWLLASNTSCTFKVMASPVPVTSNYKNKKEGWQAYSDRAELLDFAQANWLHRGLVFFSGDSHMLGVYELAPGVLEVTASPFSASAPPFPTIGGRVDRIVWEQTIFDDSMMEQFAVVDVDTTDSTNPVMNVRLFSGGIGFTESQLTVRIMPMSWAVVGGTDKVDALSVNSSSLSTALFPPAVPRFNANLLSYMLFGFGGSGFVLLLTSILACAYACQGCCPQPWCRQKVCVAGAGEDKPTSEVEMMEKASGNVDEPVQS